MDTKLLYMEQMQDLTCTAIIVDIRDSEDKRVIVLDQTIFYPQGGGQPYDTGKIANETSEFVVEEVRFVEGKVLHKGIFTKGEMRVGDSVQCQVEALRRSLHTRLHSAGHIVDFALANIGMDWVPGKGYHFPEGPYIEYVGQLGDLDKEKFRVDLEMACAEIVRGNAETQILFMEKSEMGTVCLHVPDYIAEGKQARVVMYGEKGIPCGGTHVARLGDVGKIIIRKIKQEKDIIRVAYAIE